jgi:hypothetical protein
MNSFPFPDRIRSREELKRDVLYQKIPEDDRIPICDMAWDLGVSEAMKILEKYPGKDIRGIMSGENLKITSVPVDEVRGNLRTFGEYYSAKKEIVLYTVSIAKWAKENHLDKKLAEEMVLAHEFFHCLECTKIGETSKRYMVPTLKIGKRVLVKSGVRALSEIGAHGFSRTYFENRRARVLSRFEKEEN